MAHFDNAASQLVAREALKGLIIGGLISLFFAVLVFGGRQVIPLYGMQGVIFDAIPQSVGIMLLGSMVPALITKNQIAKGKLVDIGASGRAIRFAVVPPALVMACLGIAAHALILPWLSPVAWDAVAVMAFKTLYGACLSGIAATMGVRAMIQR